jgi:MFS family permease
MIPARVPLSTLLLPAGVDRSARLLLAARSLRGFCDGFIAVLLPAYLLALGFGQLTVGLISTTTLVGSAVATIAIGVLGNRYPQRALLLVAAILMATTALHLRACHPCGRCSWSLSSER